MKVLLFVAVAVIAYLIGGISIANCLSLRVIGKKITDVGSGNAGASNMIRNCGWAAGLGTLAFDAAKAVAALALVQFIAGQFFDTNTAMMAADVAAVFVIIGHIWPVFSNFNGGKGVACTLGSMLYLMPIPTIIVFGIVIIATLIFKTMSISSFVGIILMVVLAFSLYPISQPENIPFLVTVCAIFIIVVFTHRQNIKRLIKGEEAKVKISSDNKNEDK